MKTLLPAEINMNNFLLFVVLFSAVHFSSVSFAQSDLENSQIEQELQAVGDDAEDFEPGPEIIPAPEIPQAPAKKNPVIVERNYPVDDVSPDRNINRYPTDPPLFVKPPGPKKGGSVRVPHPRAAQGLQRINRDGSYQYRTATKEKSSSGSFKVSQMEAPFIQGAESAVTYSSMYGSSELTGIAFDYEWQPFRGFGSLGLQLGTGFWTASGKGTFKRNPAEKSEETYNLFIIPVSAFLNYRFEFVRRQWIVPFVSGGGTFYGMVEVRDDGKSPGFGGAPAVGGGGGLMLSISRLDSESAFRMSEEYGVSDMWLILEARVMQGLDESTDFSGQTISAGVAVDF